MKVLLRKILYFRVFMTNVRNATSGGPQLLAYFNIYYPRSVDFFKLLSNGSRREDLPSPSASVSCFSSCFMKQTLIPPWFYRISWFHAAKVNWRDETWKIIKKILFFAFVRLGKSSLEMKFYLQDFKIEKKYKIQSWFSFHSSSQ
jgi:hypothetical protein